MFGSLYRRVEQTVLQASGLASSSYQKKEYEDDEARLERVDASLRAIAASQQEFKEANARSAEANLKYLFSLRNCLSVAMPLEGGAVGAPSAVPAHLVRHLDLVPLVRMIKAQHATVSSANERLLLEGMRRVRLLQGQVATLRGEFETRKSKVLDHDSYTRRAQGAEAALASAVGDKKVEARDALRKAEGKVRDCAALVAQMNARVRSTLAELELALKHEAEESALSFLAQLVNSGTHSGETSSALLGTYPGAARYVCELACGVTERAYMLVSAMAQAGSGSGSGEGGGGAGGDGEGLHMAASFKAALQAPYTVLSGGASGRGDSHGGTPTAAVAARVANSEPFAALHAGAAPPAAAAGGASGAPAPAAPSVAGFSSISVRPPGSAPGPQRSALAAAAAAAAAAPTAPVRSPSLSNLSERGGAASAAGSRRPSTPGGELSESEGGGVGAAQGGAGGSAASSRAASPTLSGFALALFDYNASQTDELSFSKGQFLRVSCWAVDEEVNWLRGCTASGGGGGAQGEGVFPANYVRRVSLAEAAAAGLKEPVATGAALVVPPPVACRESPPGDNIFDFS